MQIGIDVRCLMHKNYSGVGEYTFNLLDNLFRLDRQNTYKLFYNSKSDVKQNLPQFTYPNVKYYPSNYPNKLFNLSLKIFNSPQLDKLIAGVDVFWLPNLNFTAFSPDCKKIITIHDLSYKKFPHFFSLKRKTWHTFIQPAKLLKKCSRIIAISQNTKQDIVDTYNIEEEKIHIIYSGIDHNTYKILDTNLPNFAKIRNKYNLPAKFIFYLGTLEPRKNIEGIIEAFNLLKKDRQFSDLNLVIAGEKGWNYKRIFNLAKESSFKKHIRFIGYIQSRDKTYLYNLCELFIFPSFYEGFGLPVLEAQACGKPVIAGLNSSFPEILGDSAILINPENINEIKIAMEHILTNSQLKEKLIAKGIDNAKKYSWSNCAQETLKYLTQ
jgi:glycosyltransferase involved in cell wall biosynthesis